MEYNFDEINDRYNTASIKWDGLKDKNREVIRLQVADMDFKTADVIIDKMKEVADRGIYGYTSDKVKSEYRDSIRWWFKEFYDLDINNEEIIYSDGSLETMKTAIYAFTNPGDGIIIQRPVYGSFNRVIEDQTKRVVVNSPMINNDGYYTIDYEDLEEKCKNPLNKILVLCSPQNPVGRLWTKEEIKKIHEITSKNDIILISDEVHCDLVRDGNVHYPIYKCIDDYKNVIMITAISKSFNLAGLKCANAIIKDERLRGQFISEFGNRTPTPFALEALIAAYSKEGKKWLDELNLYIDKSFDLIEKYLRENMPRVKFTRPQGTYMAWLDFSDYGFSDKDLHEMIYEKAKVYLQDGLVHDPENGGQFQRMCVCSPKSLVIEALERINKELSK